ncbi:MAG: hypothetical protein EOM45_11900 [Clostridia bacterium]|nr:hypothetical protein [Clostridia bacterium]
MNWDKTEATPTWGRQEGETTKAYAAFCAYRDYGIDRSIQKVVNKYIENAWSMPLLLRWSANHNWVKRCAAFDSYMDKERQKEYLAQTLEISRRQAQSARRIQDIAIERLSSLDPITLTNQELLRYLEVGMRLEREALACGPITSSTEETTNESDKIIANRLLDDLMERSKILLGQVD